MLVFAMARGAKPNKMTLFQHTQARTNGRRSFTKIFNETLSLESTFVQQKDPTKPITKMVSRKLTFAKFNQKITFTQSIQFTKIAHLFLAIKVQAIFDVRIDSI